MAAVPFISVVIPKRRIIVALLVISAGGAAWLAAHWLGQPGRTARPSLAVSSSAAIEVLAEPGKPAPGFTLMDLEGREVSLGSFYGRPVVLYFWATWCHYCLEALPELQAARQKHMDSGLEILAVNILESPDKVRAYARRHGLALPILLDLEARVTQEYAVRATPTYYFIDAVGTLQGVLVGAARPGELDERLQALLAPSN